jgi:hypothetical protein
MKVFLEKFIGSAKNETSGRLTEQDQLKRQVASGQPLWFR